MTEARQRLGRRGEDLVARGLQAAGWRIIARNCRVKEVRGEIDVIAMDGDTLVVVEVKTMRTGAARGPETPAAMVRRRKQRKLRALGISWLRENGDKVPYHRRLRFDVVAVVLDGAGRVTKWDHLEAAF
jgi:putative endonuclease